MRKLTAFTGLKTRCTACMGQTLTGLKDTRLYDGTVWVKGLFTVTVGHSLACRLTIQDGKSRGCTLIYYGAAFRFRRDKEWAKL